MRLREALWSSRPSELPEFRAKAILFVPWVLTPFTTFRDAATLSWPGRAVALGGLLGFVVLMVQQIVSSAGFGALGVAIHGCTGIAEDRAFGWLRQLRLTPPAGWTVAAALLATFAYRRGGEERQAA